MGGVATNDVGIAKDGSPKVSEISIEILYDFYNFGITYKVFQKSVPGPSSSGAS